MVITSSCLLHSESLKIWLFNIKLPNINSIFAKLLLLNEKVHDVIFSVLWVPCLLSLFGLLGGLVRWGYPEFGIIVASSAYLYQVGKVARWGEPPPPQNWPRTVRLRTWNAGAWGRLCRSNIDKPKTARSKDGSAHSLWCCSEILHGPPANLWSWSAQSLLPPPCFSAFSACFSSFRRFRIDSCVVLRCGALEIAFTFLTAFRYSLYLDFLAISPSKK